MNIDIELPFQSVHKHNLMDIEADKKCAYLDEYKIIRTLGAGYHAE
jgi:hypothetical protein